MTDGRHWFGIVHEMTYHFQDAGIEPQVFWGAATGQHQGIVAARIDLVEGSLEHEAMAGLFGIGLVALEIVNGGLDELASLPARTDRIHAMAHHGQGLEGHHDLIVLRKISGDHQDASGCHVDLVCNGPC
jgi:hypothetical protein